MLTYGTSQISQALQVTRHTALALFEHQVLTDVNTTKPGGKRHYHAATAEQVRHLARIWTRKDRQRKGSLTEYAVQQLQRGMLAPLPARRNGHAPAAAPVRPNGHAAPAELVLTPPPVLDGPATATQRTLARLEVKVDRILVRLGEQP
jgi:hypothetical protein